MQHKHRCTERIFHNICSINIIALKGYITVWLKGYITVWWLSPIQKKTQPNKLDTNSILRRNASCVPAYQPWKRHLGILLHHLLLICNNNSNNHLFLPFPTLDKSQARPGVFCLLASAADCAPCFWTSTSQKFTEKIWLNMRLKPNKLDTNLM